MRWRWHHHRMDEDDPEKDRAAWQVRGWSQYHGEERWHAFELAGTDGRTYMVRMPEGLLIATLERHGSDPAELARRFGPHRTDTQMELPIEDGGDSGLDPALASRKEKNRFFHVFDALGRFSHVVDRPITVPVPEPGQHISVAARSWWEREVPPGGHVRDLDGRVMMERAALPGPVDNPV